MIHPTRGIVLNHIKYGESGIVVNVYTERFGRQAYMLNRGKSKRSKGLSVLLQPLALLEMQVYHREKSEIQRIKDFKVASPLTSIPFNQNKRAMAFFLTELMSRVLREEEENTSLFEFIFHSIEVFDSGLPGDHNFHLFFLFQLTRFLGFGPNAKKMEERFFDLINGQFTTVEPAHGTYLDKQASQLWRQLFGLRIEDLEQLKISAADRNLLLDYLLTYYTLHLDGMGEIKSLEVLRQLFHESSR